MGLSRQHGRDFAQVQFKDEKVNAAVCNVVCVWTGALHPSLYVSRALLVYKLNLCMSHTLGIHREWNRTGASTWITCYTSSCRRSLHTHLLKTWWPVLIIDLSICQTAKCVKTFSSFSSWFCSYFSLIKILSTFWEPPFPDTLYTYEKLLLTCLAITEKELCESWLSSSHRASLFSHHRSDICCNRDHKSLQTFLIRLAVELTLKSRIDWLHQCTQL